MKAKVLFLVDEYEYKMKSEITGRKKSDYVGEIGNAQRGTYPDQFDVEFADGQKWCFDREQLEFCG